MFESWNTRRAIDYRKLHDIPDTMGTAVNVVAMVFGNLGEDSGTGVAFSRDPSTGERTLYGEYLLNAQGEDVVVGARTPLPITTLKDRLPASFQELERVARTLERHFRDLQDMEFTIERGTLYMLQTRRGQRSGQAAVRVACEMVDEGLISRGRSGRPHPAERSQPAAASHDRSAQPARPAHHRTARLARRGLRHGGVRRRPGGAAGPRRSARDSGAAGDLARGFSRNGDGQGGPHRPRRHDVTCRGRGARDGKAVRGGRPGAAGGRARRTACPSTADRSPRATGSRWTAAPARCSPGRPPW